LAPFRRSARHLRREKVFPCAILEPDAPRGQDSSSLGSAFEMMVLLNVA